MWNEILVRYGELTLKGRNRMVFVRRLRKNIKNALHDLSSVKVDAERDRMFISVEDDAEKEEVLQRLPKVFGIHSFSPVLKCEPTMEAIYETALQAVRLNETDGQSFKVEIRRTDKEFPYISNELQQMIGSHVLRHIEGLSVKMRQPDILLHVDIRKDVVLLTSKVYKGAGGMPVGTSGKSLLLLSGGIDSPVAGYMMMKRGVEIEAIHFESPPFTSDLAKQKVLDLAEKLSAFGTRINLHVIPFTEIQQKIAYKIPDGESMTTTRRLMMEIADRVREDIGALGIVSGESLGQVASQTLDSLTAINEVTSTPVLRPLIAMDKLEIIQIAEEIDTYDISIRPYEDCCTIFTPAKPKTKPKLKRVKHFESFIDFEPMIEEAIQQKRVYSLPLVKESSFDDLL
ncbi:MAG TPA: tRNA uracil 4-sulfurtransferase ThiI [Sporosarcina sp.]|nr:tRNA uracil 4-sulfurtransferase ThiI [Sporosarcina sp.]